MKFIALLIPFVFAGSIALAADAENSQKETVKHSKNIFTGTRKTEHKYKQKVKDQNGDSADATVTDTKKVMKDGKVEHDKKVDAESKDKSN